MAEHLNLQLSIVSTTLLLFIALSRISVISGQTTRVFLSLNGMIIPNDGYVLASDIGIDDSGLHCNTDRSDCCRRSDHPNSVVQGHWYRPDGIEVMSFTLEDIARPGPNNFFSRNRGTGVIRLNRNGNPPDRGRFYCEVPDASGVNMTLYVNIVDVLPIPSLTEPAQTITTQTSTTIPPTTSSDALGITAPPPPVISVDPIISSGTATAGESYSLVCSVSMTESSDQAAITWLDPMNNQIMSTTGSMSTLTFNPLAASDAGKYTCSAILGSAMGMESRIISMQIPRPTVMIFSNATTDAVFVGSTVTLTCTVELSSVVDVSVTVTAELSNPSGSPLTITTSSVSGSTYTFTTTIHIVSLVQSGAYTCTASLNSSKSFLASSQPATETTTIMAVIPSPLNIRATQSSSSGPVEVSWSPPSDGANMITGYRIFYKNEMSVLLPSIATRLDLKLDGNQLGQQISIRSEKEQEFSKSIPITITESTSESSSAVATECNNNTSVALGVVIFLVVLIATSVVAALICVLLRKRSLAMKEQNKVATDDLSVSANVAYGQVKMAESSTVAVPQGVYEEFGALALGGGAKDYATPAAGSVAVTHTHPTTTMS